MSWTALELARLQFALSVAFHIVLAGFTIGLALFLCLMEGLWLRRRQQRYWTTYQYWLKVYALNVAVGIVSGVVLEYQFGSNWGGLAARAGSVIGPLMYYEVLAAFFLEAGFLGIMLFGAKKVGPRLHFFATCMVALGSLFSAFWILSANSWMHTPAGFRIDPQGRFIPTDWLAVIFNPSFPYRFTHMLLATLLGTACMVGAAGAWHLLRDAHNPSARLMFSCALWVLLLGGSLQAVVGDLHGENTLRHQPQKLAAMEGSWRRPEPGEGQPLVLFGLPDHESRSNHYQLAIPHLGSLYLRHDWHGTIKSLSEFPADEIPHVPSVFFAFRLMVGLGLLMISLGIAGLLVRRRGRLYEARRLQRATVAIAPAGFLALLAGWVVTESGRQPYTLYGLLKTADSLSPVPRELVAASTLGILLAYAGVFGLGMFYLLRTLRRPPAGDEQGPASELAERTGSGRSSGRAAADLRARG
jgi:cytochrome d ubiquinol oxidase subunit I